MHVPLYFIVKQWRLGQACACCWHILLTKMDAASLQIRVRELSLFFLFLNQNICCQYSKESSHWDSSFWHLKRMLKLRIRKLYQSYVQLFNSYCISFTFSVNQRLSTVWNCVCLGRCSHHNHYYMGGCWSSAPYYKGVEFRGMYAGSRSMFTFWIKQSSNN